MFMDIGYINIQKANENTYLHELLLEDIYHDFDMDWDDTHFFDADIFFP